MQAKFTNIRKFYTWSFIEGFNFLFPLRAIFLLSQGITISELALFASLTIIFSTLLEIPTGFIADKYSRKLSVSLGFLFEGIAYLSYIFVTDFSLVVIISFFLGLSVALRSGATESLLFDDLKKNNQQSSFLKVTTRGSSIKLASTAFASFTGSLLYVLNTSIPFILTFVANVVLALFILSFKENRKHSSIVKQIKILDGIKKVLTIRPIRTIILVDIFVLTLASIYYRILFFPKLNQLGLEVKYLGALDVLTVSLISIVLLILPRLIIKRDRPKLFIYTLLPTLVFIAFGLSNHIVLAVITGILLDIVFSARKHIIPTITNNYFSSHNRALSISSMSFITSLASALLIPVFMGLFNISFIYTIPIGALIMFLVAFYPDKK